MESIYINDREYLFYSFENNRFYLISDNNDPYNGDILEIELLNDNHIKMKLRRFEARVLQFVVYLEQIADTTEYKYYSRQKTNFYANEFEQHDLYYVSFFQYRSNTLVENYIKLKRAGARPFKFKEISNNLEFIDKDKDVFKITSRPIGEAKQLASYIIPSIPRIKTFLKSLNGKQKKIEKE